MLLSKIYSPDVYVCSFIRGHFDSHHATLVSEAKSNPNIWAKQYTQHTTKNRYEIKTLSKSVMDCHVQLLKCKTINGTRTARLSLPCHKTKWGVLCTAVLPSLQHDPCFPPPNVLKGKGGGLLIDQWRIPETDPSQRVTPSGTHVKDDKKASVLHKLQGLQNGKELVI
jgi:hypothetical protein